MYEIFSLFCIKFCLYRHYIPVLCALSPLAATTVLSSVELEDLHPKPDSANTVDNPANVEADAVKNSECIK